MAVSFGNVTDSSSKSPTHNNNGEDVYIFCNYALGTPPNNEDITYGGRTCLYITEIADSYNHGTLWVCLNAPTGLNTCNVSDSGGDASTPRVVLVSVTGARHAVAVNYNSALLILASSSSINVASAVGRTVLDFIRANNDTLVVGAGQSSLLLTSDRGSSYEAGAATVTMSWTCASNSRGTHIGVDLPLDDGTVVYIPTLPTVGNTGSGTSSPVSFNNNGDILAVGVFDGEGSLGTVSGVTYNGVALTKIVAATPGSWLGEMWGLLNPPKGSSYNVAVTMGSGTLAKVEVASILGCSIVLPTIFGAYEGLGNYPEVNLVCGLDYMVLDMIWGRAGTRTPFSGQTVSVADEISWKRGAVDYWSRYQCSDTRYALVCAAFRGLGGRTLQIPAMIG